MEFVKEHLLFTGEDSPKANLMLSAMGAFAEFERSLIRGRQREGIALAKQRGAYRGRKKTLTPERAGESCSAATGIHKPFLPLVTASAGKPCTNTYAKPNRREAPPSGPFRQGCCTMLSLS